MYSVGVYVVNNAELHVCKNFQPWFVSHCIQCTVKSFVCQSGLINLPEDGKLCLEPTFYGKIIQKFGITTIGVLITSE